MKLFINFILCFSSLPLLARDIIVISYKNESPVVELLKKQLERNLDSELISFKKMEHPCQRSYPDSVANFCLDQDDELRILSIKNEIMKNSFSQLDLFNGGSDEQ